MTWAAVARSGATKREHPREFERALWIDREVRAGRFPNARKVAARFEVSERTAQRAFDLMRDRMFAPLEYSAEHRGFFISVVPIGTRPVLTLRTSRADGCRTMQFSKSYVITGAARDHFLLILLSY
jgi:hypothetical protein